MSNPDDFVSIRLRVELTVSNLAVLQEIERRTGELLLSNLEGVEIVSVHVEVAGPSAVL